MNDIFDCVVIGAGPAGIMAAGQAAKRGGKVLLLEKNSTLGRKILITGKGRCNVTQAEFNLKKLVKDYGQNGPFLFSALHQFSPQAVVDFFTNLRVNLKVERGGRVFPESDSAKEITAALEKFLKDNGVLIWYNATVKSIEEENGEIKWVELMDRRRVNLKNLIIATGGLSYATTGSTGDGLKWAKNLGHSVTKTLPALVPLKIQEPWTKELQGLSLKNVELVAWQNNKKIASRFGEMLFTHFGISGPIVLDISREVIAAKENGTVELTINFKPALDHAELDTRLQRDFKKYQNKIFKNSLDDLAPRALIPVLIKLSGIDPEKPVNSITKEERKVLHKLFSALKMTVVGNMGYDLAIVTSGGVDLKEIDPRTMNSKKIPNLYFAGEILDIDGPTGGYNLQVAWATGYLAGNSVKF